MHRYIRYPFSEGMGPLGQIWAGYPHTGHWVLVGVGRINMAVPKPHAGPLLCWVQEICPSADVLCESSLRVWPGRNNRQQADWRLKKRGWSGRFRGLLSFIIANHESPGNVPARYSFISSIIKTQTFPFAARRAVVRHSALTLMPQLMLSFGKVHSGISKSVASS